MKPPIQGLQLPWPLIEWMLGMEGRVSTLEAQKEHGEKTTAPRVGSPKWAPRDFMMAGTGISMVIAALFEKIGWSQVFAGLVRLYGAK